MPFRLYNKYPTSGIIGIHGCEHSLGSSCVWFKGVDEHLTELFELLGTPDLFRE